MKTLNDILSLEKYPVPKGVSKKLNHPGFIYFLFFKDILVYIGKTNMRPEQRVMQHKKDKFFDSYSYIEVKEGQNADSIEKQYITQYNPIFNTDGASGDIDTHILWEYDILVIERNRRKDFGGHICIKLLSNGKVISPDEKVIGRQMPEYGLTIVFHKDIYNEIVEFIEDNRQMRLDVKPWEGCERLATRTICYYEQLQEDSESETLQITNSDLEVWAEHIMFYCYLEGVSKKNLMFCLKCWLKEIWAYDFERYHIPEDCNILKDIVNCEATEYEEPPKVYKIKGKYYTFNKETKKYELVKAA